MIKRKIYTVMAVVLVIGVTVYDYYLKEKTPLGTLDKSLVLKEEDAIYFMPKRSANQIVHHNNYSLSYNEKHEQAEWVAYELKAHHLSSTNHKRPYFEIDKAVKTRAAHWRNYKKSGFDKGHLCPAGDRRFSKKAHDETFLTSNITPQEHNFNAGVWNRLEQKVRYWAKKNNGVFVITGGVLKEGLKTIGTENISVPNHFYKIIVDNTEGHIKMIAFVIPHKNSSEPLYNFVVSVDELETITGIDFFPKLEDTLEAQLEASNSYKNWNFN